MLEALPWPTVVHDGFLVALDQMSCPKWSWLVLLCLGANGCVGLVQSAEGILGMEVTD